MHLHHSHTVSLASLLRLLLILVASVFFIRKFGVRSANSDEQVHPNTEETASESELSPQSHFNGLLELSGSSYKSFKNRFRRHLRGAQCLTYHVAGTWWHYEWCFDKHVRQFHPISATNESSIILGHYVPERSLRIFPVKNYARLRNPNYMGYAALQTFLHGEICSSDSVHGKTRNRSAEIQYKCCVFRANETYIEMVEEPETCQYVMTICTPIVCGVVQRDQYVLGAASEVSENERLVLTQTVKDMFYHAYHGYLTHAYPLDALLPISCKGEQFELGKIQMLTLIDTLDTLAILEDAKEFQHAIELVLARLPNFDIDTEVSVFETTIRVLGGLLSAHLFATDETLALFPPTTEGVKYENGLLKLAVDLGDRLMPAFKTRTGIPYGTVNLRYGVPKGETTIASTAGAGSLSMEFTMLSVLTGNPKYANAARGAARALFQRRSTLGLLGKHIDTKNGEWTELLSGPGSNSDSFYEYLLKMYMTFGDQEALEMFATVYPAVLEHNLHGDWYADVSMRTGCHHGNVVFENLAAFWPGMQVSIGHLHSASKSINSFYRVWREYGFVPEQFNVLDWRPVRGRGSRYPLRPELIESTFYMHEATNDSSWLRAGAHVVHSLQKYSKTSCGYATVADIETKEQEDNMPSFFLSETCKYLYLLFNTTHFFRNGKYVMTTEAHPFPILPSKLVDPIINADKTTKEHQQRQAPDHRLQCLKPHFLDPINYQVAYVGSVTTRTARCEEKVKQKLKSASSHQQNTVVPTATTTVKTVYDLLPRQEQQLREHLNKPASASSNGDMVTENGEDVKFQEHFNIGDDIVSDPKRAAWIEGLLKERQHDLFGTKSFRTVYGGAKFGQFRVDQIQGLFRYTREDTGEWIEASHMGDSTHLLVSMGREDRFLSPTENEGSGSGDLEDEDDLLIAPTFPNHRIYEVQRNETISKETTCIFSVVVMLTGEEPVERWYRFPCVSAGFGLSDTLTESRTFEALPVEISSPLDACGWLMNENLDGKMVIITRGLCFFETKVRNAVRRGATGVIIVNNEEDDRVIVMGSSGDQEEDGEEAEKTGGSQTKEDLIKQAALNIPVAMIPQRLGLWLDRQLAHARETGASISIGLDIKVQMLPTEQSLKHYPYVDGTLTDLRVYGPEWGVKLEITRDNHFPHHENYAISIVETPV